MSRIILCANVKGGVGKTSLCALFANYLTEKGFKVRVFDADYQASLIRHRQRETEADPETSVPWQMSMIDTADREVLSEEIAKLKKLDAIILIDCPGTLNATNLDVLYKAADMLVIPMSYDLDTVDATGLFIKVVRRVTDAELIFIPNRINVTEGKGEELKLREQTISILGKLGIVTPRIKQSVVIKRYSTLYGLDKYQRAAVEYAFERIIQELKK